MLSAALSISEVKWWFTGTQAARETGNWLVGSSKVRQAANRLTPQLIHGCYWL